MAEKKNIGSLGPALQRRRRRKRNAANDEPEQIVIPYQDGEVLTPAISKVVRQSFRRDGRLHVSDLIYKCVRRIALSERLGNPMPDESLHASTSITFKQGEAIQDFVTDRLIQHKLHQLYGVWKCMCGETSETGIGTDIEERGTRCEHCGGLLNRYHEISLVNEQYNIIGNVDITLFFDDAFMFNECKSIAQKHFDELTAPKPEHVIQVLFYWWLAKQLGMSVHDKVTVLYVCKGYVFKSPYKEFPLRPSIMLNRLEDYLEDAQALKHFNDTGEIPPRVFCATNKTADAKKCHVCDECFDLE